MEVAILSGAWEPTAVALIIIIGALALVLHRWIVSFLPETTSLVVPVAMSWVLLIGVLAFRVLFDVTLVSDEKTWHEQSSAVADFIAGQNDGALRFGAGREGYPWFVGALYFVAGKVPLVPIFLGMVVCALTVPLTAVLSGLAVERLGFNAERVRRAQRLGAYFVALNPAIAVWAPRLLRDALMMFLMAALALMLARFLRGRSGLAAIGVCAAVLAIYAIRSQVGIGVAGAVILAVVVAWSLRIRTVAVRVVLLGLSGLAVIAGVWEVASQTTDLNVENSAYLSRSLSDAASSFGGELSDGGVTSYWDMLTITIPRVAFGPFPFELNASGVMLFAAVSNVFWLSGVILALSLAFRGRRSVARMSADSGGAADWGLTLVLAVLVAVLVAILSIRTGNYGLVIRMRMMPFGLLMALAATAAAVYEKPTEPRPKPQSRPAGSPQTSSV